MRRCPNTHFSTVGLDKESYAGALSMSKHRLQQLMPRAAASASGPRGRAQVGDDADLALRYAQFLLASLGRTEPLRACATPAHPAVAWARSGLMALTGHADTPVLSPSPLAACADGVVMGLRSLAPGRLPETLEGAGLLAERAALNQLQRHGSCSPGGACRILHTATEPIAVNLARPADWELVPAWLADPERAATAPAQDWQALEAQLARHQAAPLVARGRLLGLAVAPAAGEIPIATPWCQAIGGPFPGRGGRPPPQPLVVDLSSLWAGPCCGQLLGLLGARVLKVESQSRPDGARAGEPRFFDLLNAGKESVALEFESAVGRAQLRRLLERADIVIEASRPRALRQLGIAAEDVLAARPGLTWISISGYGRSEPEANWIAYGDDAGVAAGLTARLQEVSGQWLICGDAIADPLTGLHAALAAWAGFLAGGGALLELALSKVTAAAANFALPDTPAARRMRYRRWSETLTAAAEPIGTPRVRAARTHAAELGAHTAAVLSELGWD
jgi:crotonobetainyl-CoA:carnitine CoA-transferase CaiB-like acyl-CoA transferase